MTGRVPVRELTAEEAIELIVTGAQRDADKGGVALDVTLIDLLRAGKLKAGILDDGQLAFMKIGDW